MASACASLRGAGNLRRTGSRWRGEESTGGDGVAPVSRQRRWDLHSIEGRWPYVLRGNHR
ncbi:hypothetical protein [Azospirillum largimobile]